jgi:glycine/D-amino acid oxidase-like deaminating enzyme
MARQLDIAEGSRYRPVVRINTLADADATAPTLMIRAAPVTFPISISSPIRHPGPPPSACDVVVIGGGVIGVMTAWFLAEPGLRVTLCEKGRIAGEQSSRNWGWLRQQGRDPAELPIMVESLRIWDRLAQEFGDALGVRRTGVMYLADTEADLVAYEAWLAHAQANELDTHMLGRAEVIDRLRGSAGLWRGALFTPSDALAEPWAAVPVFAEGATTRGAVIVENCAVRALDRQGGRIAGVITEAGRITCEQVVLAGGAWSSLLLRAEGVTLPQLAVLASVAATEPLPEVFPGAAADGRFAFRRRADGGYTLAAGGGTASSSAPMPCAMHAHLCPSCEGTGARCG